MKRLVSIFFVLQFLNSCGTVGNYSDINNGYTSYQAVQYSKTIGYTDNVKQLNDMKECGFSEPEKDKYNIFYDKNDKNFSEMRTRVESIRKCMKEKGYIIFSKDMCTYDGEELGICN